MKNKWLYLAAFLVMTGCSTVASSPHYTEGTRAIERGDYQTAVKELEQAIQLEPRVSRYHNNLAFAYFHLGNEQKGWYHLRQAVLLDPDNRYAVASFNGYWGELEKNGKVRIGMPTQELVKNLGEPDLTLKIGDETSLVWGLKRIHLRGELVASIEKWVGK
jgi:tetratricopeptide (TPR) repeat protein